MHTVQLPGVAWASGCPGGSGTATVYNALAGVAFGPTLAVATTNYGLGVTWSVTSVTNADVTCNVTAASLG